MKFETPEMLKLKQDQESKEILEQTAKLCKTQEEKLPLVIEGLKAILMEVRKLNDLQLKSEMKGTNAQVKLLVVNAANTSFLLEEDLRKDMMKYEKDLIGVELVAKRIEESIKIIEEGDKTKSLFVPSPVGGRDDSNKN